MIGNDFTSLHRKYEIGKPGGAGFGSGFKKLPSMNFVAAAQQQNEPAVEDLSGNADYIIASEYKSEIIYQELMPKLLTLDEHIHN